jgi:hypothetical protein
VAFRYCVNVVTEYYEVVQFAHSIGDMVTKQRLGFETQVLEHRDCRVLIDRHLCDKFLYPEFERLCEALLDERPSEASSARGGRYKDP